jgi:hypothetical protein
MANKKHYYKLEDEEKMTSVCCSNARAEDILAYDRTWQQTNLFLE